MIRAIFVFVIVLLQAGFSFSQVYFPDIPCPEIFQYIYDGRSWYAYITAPTPTVHRVVLSLRFSVQDINLPNYGKITLYDKDKVFDDIRHGRPLKYKVAFPPSKYLPKITEIKYNDVVLCSGTGVDPPRTNFWLTYTLNWKSSSIHLPEPIKPQTPNPPFYEHDSQFHPQNPSFQQPNPQFHPQNPPYHEHNPQFHPQNPPYHEHNPQFHPQNPPYHEQNPQFHPQNSQFQPPNPPFQPQTPTPDYNQFTSKPDSNPLSIFPPFNYQPNVTIPNIIPQDFTTSPINKPETGLSNKNKIQNWPQCGTTRIKRESPRLGKEYVPLIYNGTPIARNEHPWLAALYDADRGSLKFFCGGNLISNKHVITAAHCMTSKNVVEVKVGAHSTVELFEKGAIIKEIKSVKIHPEYRKGSAHADISIILLSSEVNFIDTIKPVCLWDLNTNLNEIVGQNGKIIGWGLTEKGDTSTTPLQTDVEIVSHRNCQSVKLLQNSVSEKTFCAGTKGTGPCLGDSGGGLYIYIDGKWYLRGIISTSLFDNIKRLCDVNTYSVYTDTAKYSDWIIDNMK